MQSNILTIAQRISNLQTFSARSRLGNRGDLIEVENNQIIKNEIDHPLGRNIFAEKERAIVEELPDTEDDLDFLDSAFTTLFDSMGLGDNSTYWSGLRMLKNQIQAF